MIFRLSFLGLTAAALFSGAAAAQDCASHGVSVPGTLAAPAPCPQGTRKPSVKETPQVRRQGPGTYRSGNTTVTVRGGVQTDIRVRGR